VPSPRAGDLVNQVRDWYSGAAVNFDEGEYPSWSLTDERSRGRGTGGQKTCGPEGDENGSAAALHSRLLCRGRVRPKIEHNGFGVPQPRRPENRATPLDVARLMVWSRNQGAAANTRLGPEYAV